MSDNHHELPQQLFFPELSPEWAFSQIHEPLVPQFQEEMTFISGGEEVIEQEVCKSHGNIYKTVLNSFRKLYMIVY